MPESDERQRRRAELDQTLAWIAETLRRVKERDEQPQPLGELALWTPGERDVLAVVARTRGWEWARRYAPRILAEARAVDGDLDHPHLPVPARN